MNYFLIALFIGGSALLPGQAPTLQSVLNNASVDTQLCPGGTARVSGNFGPKATVTVGGKPAFVFHSSANLLTIQIPAELGPGPANLVVTNPGGAASKVMPLTLNAAAPGLLSIDSSGGNDGFFFHADGETVGPNNPATPGELILANAAGLGPTNPAVPTGAITHVNAPAAQAASATLDGTPVAISFAGLPGTKDISLIGTYQIAFTVPANANPGTARFVLTIGNYTSNAVKLRVKK